MHRGYIKLWRKSLDSSLYRSEPFTKWQAWIDLIMLANHKAGTIHVRNIPVKLARGQVAAGEEYLMDRWLWKSRGKIRRFLNHLETEQQIVQQKNNVINVISITNYNDYQSDGTANDTTNSTTDGQQTDTPKNVKKAKNEKKSSRFAPPALEEVSKYTLERMRLGKPRVDPETFIDHYTMKGWKVGTSPMKDWKAAVRTWEKRAAEKKEPQQIVGGI